MAHTQPQSRAKSPPGHATAPHSARLWYYSIRRDHGTVPTLPSCTPSARHLHMHNCLCLPNRVDWPGHSRLNLTGAELLLSCPAPQSTCRLVANQHRFTNETLRSFHPVWHYARPLVGAADIRSCGPWHGPSMTATRCSDHTLSSTSPLCARWRTAPNTLPQPSLPPCSAHWLV